MFSEMGGAIKACLTSGHGDKGTSSPCENPFTKATRKQNTTSVQNSARWTKWTNAALKASSCRNGEATPIQQPVQDTGSEVHSVLSKKKGFRNPVHW